MTRCSHILKQGVEKTRLVVLEREPHGMMMALCAPGRPPHEKRRKRDPEQAHHAEKL
jgi:hypothetical protein